VDEHAGPLHWPGRTEVLFYSPGDYNWWLATSNAGPQQWALVGQGAG